MQYVYKVFLCVGYCPQGCYNNGSCVSPYTCACTAGWTGTDCSTGLYVCGVITYVHKSSDYIHRLSK